MWHREVTLPSSGATVDVLFLDTEVNPQKVSIPHQPLISLFVSHF